MEHVAIVRAALAEAGVAQPPAIERAARGVGNHVYLAGDVVVRLGTGSDAVHFDRAAAIMTAAAAAGVRVPELVLVDTSMARFPLRLMVVARASGQPLADAWPRLNRARRLDAMHQVADQLARLHALAPAEVRGFSFPEPWYARRLDEIDRWLVELRGLRDYPPERFDAMRALVIANRPALDAAAPAIVHDDVNWGNVLFDGGDLSALLDFDDARAGPIEIDAWGLVDAAGLDDAWVEPRELAGLADFDLAADGVLERSAIDAVHAILEHLSGRLSWQTAGAALADAHEIWDEVFAGQGHRDLVAAIDSEI